MFETPILFIVFNRPEVTLRIFKEIKKQKPKYLFIAADGPRAGVEDDIDKCKRVREVVLNGIDWDCEVKTLFRDENLGCGKAVSGAIDWFFEKVEMGIILEDDCLPNHSFFGFCKTLLERYKYEDQVYAISGNNFQDGIQRGEASYYFSHYAFVWGWATWRRAWENYDYNLIHLENFKRKKLIKRIDKRKIFENYWNDIFAKTSQNKIDTWDYQWIFAIWYNKGVVAIPNVNLISNIGFGKNATHTKEINQFANLSTSAIDLIEHPNEIRVNKDGHYRDSSVVFNILTKREEVNRFKNLLYKQPFISIQKRMSLIIKFKKKIKRILAPEIIQLIRRKRTSSLRFENDFLKIPRYTETTAFLNGKEIIVPDNASFTFMHKEIFEEEIYKFITQNPEPYIIDGGANIGLATIYFKKLYPACRIVAFEPDPKIFKVLENNIKKFNFDKIDLVQKGLWNCETKLNFLSEGADAGIITNLDRSRSSTLEIKTTSLKVYLNQPVDLLKLDIEGAETVVLLDIEKDLDKVDRIFVEYHSFVKQPQTLDEIIGILKRANFRVYTSIPGNNSIRSPFMGLKPSNNMDFQLNIFGFKEGVNI